MNIMALIMLLVFSFMGSFAGRQLQAMFANDVSRISSPALRTGVHNAIYALGTTVVVWVLAMLVGINISVLFWFVLLFVFEYIFNPRR